MTNPIQEHIEQVKKQPAPARLRAAICWTGVSGAILVAAWAFILLPIQLRLTSKPLDRKVVPAAIVSVPDKATATPIVNEGVVSGAVDRVEPIPTLQMSDTYFSLPSASPAAAVPSASVTPSPAATSRPLNAPVQITK